MTALTTFFSHPLSLAERFAVAVDQIKSQERVMSNYDTYLEFISAADANDRRRFDAYVIALLMDKVPAEVGAAVLERAAAEVNK